MVIGLEETDNGSKEKTQKEVKKFMDSISEEAKQRLEEVWNAIYNEAIANCPIDTGSLVGTIKLQTENEISEEMQGVGGSYVMEGGGEKAVSIFNGTITAGDDAVINPKNNMPTTVYAALVHDGHFDRAGNWIEGVFFLTDAIDAHELELEEAIDAALKSLGAE